MLIDLKSLQLKHVLQVDIDTMKKDFKSKEVYGALAGAMKLAELSGSPGIRNATAAEKNRISGRKSFKSKFIGSIDSSENGVSGGGGGGGAGSNPTVRAKLLLEKIV